MTKVSRRGFIKALSQCACAGAAAGALQPITPSIAFAANSCAAGNRVLVHLFLDGGMDSAHFLIPRSLGAYFDKRPTLAINNSLVLSSAFGLNPVLTNLFSMYQDGDVAIVNKVGYPDSNRSHDESRKIYERGLRYSNDQKGWLGRFADLHCSSSNEFELFSFAGSVGDFKASSIVPITSGSLSSYRYETDYGGGSNDSRYREEISELVRDSYNAPGAHGSAIVKGFDAIDASIALVSAAENNYTSGVSYPNTSLGRKLRDAAKLLQENVPTSVISIHQGGYDTHSGQMNKTNSLFGDLDSSIGAFVTDLKAMTIFDEVVLLVESEFGRNTFENGSNGTDHGHGTIQVVIGGGVNGGVKGPNYTSADFNSAPWLPGSVDFRNARAEIIDQFLGKDPDAVFPENYSVTNLNII